jgi:sulfate adenylyltransferase/3'-phosphoadenosine 5'-phosphosulfate synthase
MPRGFVLWFTGLSGSGKSTLASMVAAELRRRGIHVETLDGDEIRKHLSKGLGFSRNDRDENIRRIGFVAKLVSRSGACAIAATISPYRDVRNEVRGTAENFVEVYAECPIDVLSNRDPKGLYKKALAGEIRNFTGVDDPYEAPESPEVHVHTDRETPEQSLGKILEHLERAELIPAWGQWRKSGDLSGSQLVAAHGLEVVDRTVTGDAAARLIEGARTLPHLDLDFDQHVDLCYVATGVYSPLRGFMNSKDYLRVAREMRLENGLPWGIPVTLRANAEAKARFATKDRVALRVGGRPVAVLAVDDVWKAEGAAAETFFVGGEVQCADAALPGPLKSAATPADVRDRMLAFGWGRVAAIPTAQIPLGGVEYVARAALEFSDGILVQTLVAPNDDVDVQVRGSCFEALFSSYFAPNRAVVAPLARKRDPDPVRAVINDAILAKNFGASRLVLIGGSEQSDKTLGSLGRFASRELGVELWPVAEIVVSERLGGLATRRSAPDARERHDPSAVMEAFRSGRDAPAGVRPEVARILREVSTKTP